MTKTRLWPNRYELDELLSTGFLVAFVTFHACLIGRALGVA